MILEKFGEGIRNTLSRVAKSLFVDDKLINELVKDIQRELLLADVNVQLVFKLTERIKARAKDEKPAGLTKREQLVNIVYEELVEFLGGPQAEIQFTARPHKILLVGLYGSGKTTAAAKLAKYYQKRGKRVVIVGLDTFRAAAMDQLSQLTKFTGIRCFIDNNQKDPVEIYRAAGEELSKFDVAIIDTAGRDALSNDLVEEISRIKDAVDAEENLLVLSADIGQAAQKQAESFQEHCGITGVIISKMDGTARGGGALSACSATSAPVRFISTGEKIDDLETFDAKAFVGRLLGMGDLTGLLEKARGAISEEDAKGLERRLLKGDFNLLDLYQQMEAMNKMGPLGSLIDMIPGMSQVKLPKDALKVQEKNLIKWRHAMDSMTQEELEEPDIIDGDRIARISRGSGVPEGDIRGLIRQHRQSKKMVKMLKGDVNPEKILRQLKSKHWVI